MVGVAAGIPHLTDVNKQLIHDAGIKWLRMGGLGLDAEKFLKNENQPAGFFELKEKITALQKEGFNIIGITPKPTSMPKIAGTPGSPTYFDHYRRICAFLGKEYQGLIDYWQVANELDIWIFRDTLTLDQSIDFLKAGIVGLKESGPQLKVGINITLFPSLPGEVDGNTDLHEGVYIAKAIYRDSGLDLDYAGFDSYPGTWRRGGPESWNDYLDAFHELTGKPVLIQEFGYASEGEVMTEEEDKSGIYPCAAKKWRFAWRGGHTREIQAEFIDESFRIFSQKPYVIGAIYFRWDDPETCWQCGESDCPAETAWGLVDRNGNPKPSYYSLQSSVKKYFPNTIQ